MDDVETANRKARFLALSRLVFIRLLRPTVFICVCLLVWYLFTAPLFRASAYPLFAWFRDNNLGFQRVPEVFSLSKDPILVFTSSGAHFYKLRVYSLNRFLHHCIDRDLSGQLKNQLLESKSRSQSGKAVNTEEIKYLHHGELLSRLVLPDLEFEGLFRPLEFDSAEARFNLKGRLLPGSYVCVFESKKFFSDSGDRKIVVFGVTESSDNSESLRTAH